MITESQDPEPGLSAKLALWLTKISWGTFDGWVRRHYRPSPFSHGLLDFHNGNLDLEVGQRHPALTLRKKRDGPDHSAEWNAADLRFSVVLGDVWVQSGLVLRRTGYGAKPSLLIGEA
jgi:hypothetical protein